VEETSDSNRNLDSTKIYANIEGTVVKEHTEKVSKNTVNIDQELEKRGWVTRLNRPGIAGIFSYKPEMAKLFLIFKNIGRELAFARGFEEMIFPRHYSASALDAFGWTGHPELKSELMLISPLNPTPGRSNQELLGDPLQCTGFYETLRQMQASNGDTLPEHLFADGLFKVYEDQGGWTVRNEKESRLQSGFSTGFEFAGAEFVWAGTQDDSYAIRWTILNDVLDCINNLGLMYRIIISGSCTRDAENPELIGQELPLYKIPTLDIELYIPALEGTEKGPWLEIGGGDYAGSRIANKFGLKDVAGKEIYTGCQGIGWQRIIYSFLSQKGLDYQEWPEPIKTQFSSRQHYKI
jgi:seryl-tRNA synthetase